MGSVPENFDNCLVYCPRERPFADRQLRFDALIEAAQQVGCHGPIVLEYVPQNAEATNAQHDQSPTLAATISCGAICSEQDVIAEAEAEGDTVTVVAQEELRKRDNN